MEFNRTATQFFHTAPLVSSRDAKLLHKLFWALSFSYYTCTVFVLKIRLSLTFWCGHPRRQLTRMTWIQQVWVNPIFRNKYFQNKHCFFSCLQNSPMIFCSPSPSLALRTLTFLKWSYNTVKLQGVSKYVCKAPGDQVQSNCISEPGPQEPCREICLKHSIDDTYGSACQKHGWRLCSLLLQIFSDWSRLYVGSSILNLLTSIYCLLVAWHGNNWRLDNDKKGFKTTINTKKKNRT
jgi:hypothetical protein